MGRIRTIKPEFWRDEKIASLKNKLAGYFFIGLWNVADDYGYFQLSPKQLSLELPIFRSKEVVTYISDLSQVGLIRISTTSQVGLISGWKHQRIKDRLASKWNNLEIIWDDVPVDTLWSYKKPLCIRKGKERKGILRYQLSNSVSPSLDDRKSFDFLNSEKPEEEFSPKDFILLWNENCGTLPKVKELNDARKKICKIRISEKPEKSYWIEVIQKLAKSNFCSGENQSGWQATFDFLIKKNTHLKVLEGTYDNFKEIKFIQSLQRKPEEKTEENTEEKRKQKLEEIHRKDEALREQAAYVGLKPSQVYILQDFGNRYLDEAKGLGIDVEAAEYLDFLKIKIKEVLKI